VTCPAYHIREMTPEDVPAVMDIERDSFPVPWSEPLMRALLMMPETMICLVAEAGGRICGYVTAAVGYEELHVLSIAMSPGTRGSGGADMLLAGAIERGRPRGCLAVILEVRENNERAQRFYRRHGFRTIGRRPRYYADSGEDAILLQKDIEETG
jgi:[ribosomal protein S18]-alanine N-acetyltransferase